MKKMNKQMEIYDFQCILELNLKNKKLQNMEDF